VEITWNYPAGQVKRGIFAKPGGGGSKSAEKSEGKPPLSSGDASPHPSAVIGGAHLSCNRLVLFRFSPVRYWITIGTRRKILTSEMVSRTWIWSV